MTTATIPTNTSAKADTDLFEVVFTTGTKVVRARNERHAQDVAYAAGIRSIVGSKPFGCTGLFDSRTHLGQACPIHPTA